MDTGNLSQKDVITLKKSSTGLKLEENYRLSGHPRITIEFSNVKLISEVSFEASNVKEVIIRAKRPNQVLWKLIVPFKDSQDLLSNDVMCQKLDIEFVPVDICEDACIRSVKVDVCEKAARGWPFRSIKSLPPDIKENDMITDLRSVQSKLIGRRYRRRGKIEEDDSEDLKQLNRPIVASMRLKHFLILKGKHFDKLKSDSSLVKVCSTLESAFFEYKDKCNLDNITIQDFIRNCALRSKVIRLSCCRYEGDFEYQWWTYRFVTPRCGGIIVDRSKKFLLIVKGFHIWSKWNFVSGKMHDDEDKKTSALREIQEEVGQLGQIRLGDCLVDKECVPNVYLFFTETDS